MPSVRCLTGYLRLSRREGENPHVDAHPRQGCDYRFRPRGLHRRHLCRARDAGAGADPGIQRGPFTITTDVETIRVRRRHQGPCLMSRWTQAASRRPVVHRYRDGARSRPAPFRLTATAASLSRRHVILATGAQGALARPALRENTSRGVGLRHLRRLLLSRQERGGDRGGNTASRRAVLTNFPPRHRGASPRHFRARASCKTACSSTQDRGDLGQRPRRHLRETTRQGHRVP